MENVILVDEFDEQIGIMEKLQAHQKGLLHRCFSIFIFDSNNRLLIQQRAQEKYHCGGLWANTCCSHPRPDEKNDSAAHRRLVEEMGFDCDLEEVLTFIYKADFDNGLKEHEFDHVFIGYFDGEPHPNPEEVQDYTWMSIEELEKDFKANPDNYAIWLKIALPLVKEYLTTNIKN